MPELDRIERPLRPVRDRQGIGLAVRGRLGIEVPELEGAAASDGVERGAQLVAHAGEKLRLVPARNFKLPVLVLKLLARMAQLRYRPLQFQQVRSLASQLLNRVSLLDRELACAKIHDAEGPQGMALRIDQGHPAVKPYVGFACDQRQLRKTLVPGAVRNAHEFRAGHGNRTGKVLARCRPIELRHAVTGLGPDVRRIDDADCRRGTSTDLCRQGGKLVVGQFGRRTGYVIFLESRGACRFLAHDRFIVRDRLHPGMERRA